MKRFIHFTNKNGIRLIMGLKEYARKVGMCVARNQKKLMEFGKNKNRKKSNKIHSILNNIHWLSPDVLRLIVVVTKRGECHGPNMDARTCPTAAAASTPGVHGVAMLLLNVLG